MQLGVKSANLTVADTVGILTKLLLSLCLKCAKSEQVFER